MKFLLYLFLTSAVVASTALAADHTLDQGYYNYQKPWSLKESQVSMLVDQMLSGKPTKAFETYAAELTEYLQDNKSFVEQLKKTAEIVADRPVSVMTAWQQYKLIAAQLISLQTATTDTECVVTDYMKKAYILMNFVPGCSLEDLEKQADKEVKKIAVAAYLMKKIKEIPAEHMPAEIKTSLEKKSATDLMEILKKRLQEDKE